MNRMPDVPSEGVDCVYFPGLLVPGGVLRVLMKLMHMESGYHS